MASFERSEVEQWVQSWLQANRDCEAAGDWKPLADFYAPDATYGWNIGPKEDVMCVGIDEIRDVALGYEMEGLQNWQYPYQKVIIDDRQGEIVGFWKQVVTDGDGGRQEIYGIGGSWFRLNADKLIEWQRDFFDFGHVQALYLDLMKAGKLSAGMQRRIEGSLAGERLPATTRWVRRPSRSGDPGTASRSMHPTKHLFCCARYAGRKECPVALVTTAWASASGSSDQFNGEMRSGPT